MEHAAFVKALRDAADFFEARPELGVPYGDPEFTFCGFIGGKSIDSKEGLALFVKSVGGRVDKEGDDYLLTLRAKRQGFSVRALAYREKVCERVLVTTKTEPAHVLPAQPATEEVFVPRREVPVYEWRCPSILAGEGEPVQDAEPLNHADDDFKDDVAEI